MSWLIAIALVLLVVAVLIALTPTRAWIARALARLRGRVAPARQRPHTGVTIIAPDGQEYEVPGETARPSLATRLESAGGTRRVLVGAIVAVLLIVAFVQLYQQVLSPQPEHFVVLVAPFHEPGSPPGQTGREVASALVDELNRSDGLIVARAVDEPPADTGAALQALDRTGADALIWGEVTPGGMLDRESLTPLLVYRPSGPFAPYAWEGYAGRFDMPVAYALASAPINGRVVLPPLLSALANYGAGKVDVAFDTLGQLMDRYPAVAPALPRALRGNILWARGAYPAAADEYRRALGSLSQAEDPQAAMLYNNLGAILQDAGDVQAQAAFDQAIAALQGQDLGALRYNLGLQAERAGNLDGAIQSLEIARSPGLLPQNTPTAPLLLTLTDAYRLSGRFADARQTLDTATQQAHSTVLATTPDLQNVLGSGLDASAEAERALLSLAEAAGARGPLPWEAETSATLPVNVLNDARRSLSQSADDTQVQAQRWARIAVSKDAAAEPAAGQIATRHALRAQELQRSRRRWLAGIDIEIARARNIQEPRGLGAVWAAIVGNRSALGSARSALEDLVKTQPNDVDSWLLLGRSYLITGSFDKAGESYDTAARLAPQRPEPVYGQGLVALRNDQVHENRVSARLFLQRAIDLDPAFFPARAKLAQIAEEEDDWATAIAQRRWLLDNRPSGERRANTLALAETLRRSGQANFAEAERLLLPLANQNDVDALLALSGLYVDKGDPQAAADVLARAEQAAPNNPEPPYRLAELLREQNDQTGAERAYNRALTINPKHVPSLLGLGGLYASQNKLDQASQRYRQALDAGADDPAALKQIGKVLLDNKQYSPAVEAYNRALRAPEAGNDAQLRYELGQAYLGLNQLDSAEKEEQRALELRENVFPEALTGLGDVALRQDKLDLAEQRYSAALSQNPALTGAQLGLGRVAAQQGNWSVADAHFRDAIASADALTNQTDRRSVLAAAHLARGEALLKLDRASEAIEEYSLANQQRPNDPEVFYGLAQAQRATGQIDLAQDNLALALQLRPAYPQARLLQGLIFEQQGQPAAAIDAYSKSIDAGGKLAEPYYRRALLYMSAQRLDDAARDLEKAIGIQPNFPEAHYWLGRAYLAQSRPRPARDQLALAAEQRGGDYPDALFYQGLAEEQLGQRSQALASYQAALAQNGSGEWANEARLAVDRLR